MRVFSVSPDRWLVSVIVSLTLIGAPMAGAADDDRKKPPTFRERVERFWSWWEANGERVYKAVDDDGGRSIQPEVSKVLDDLSPDFGWTFGPGANGKGHSLTVTPEANSTKRPLVDYWHSKAREIPGWTFYPARQPSAELDGIEITLGGASVSVDELWITPEVDEEAKQIDITAWNPVFDTSERDQAGSILFVLLDAALGEQGTSDWLGGVDLGKGKSETSIPLTELPAYIDKAFEEHGWEKMERGGTVYQFGEPLGDFPRGDTIAGSTVCMDLVAEYLDNEGPIEQELTESGVRFVFVQMPMTVLGEGEPVEARSKIEDIIEEKLVAADAGAYLGGALGSRSCYIDLVVFDARRAKGAIEAALKEAGLEGKYKIRSFTK